MALVRIAAGWKPHASFMRPEIRAKALKRAGEVTGEKRRRARHQRVLTKLGGFLTPQFCDELSPRQVAAVKALLARAYIRGRADGYGSGWDCGRRTGQKGQAA